MPTGESGSILTVMLVTISVGAASAMSADFFCVSSSVASSARAVSSSGPRMRRPFFGPSSRTSAGLVPKNDGVLATAVLLATEKCSET